MDKLTMAHDWYMKHGRETYNLDSDVSNAWQYADAMQAEADKREKEGLEKKRSDIREMLKANNTFVEREGQHFDDVEWQPDWSQLPNNANYWSMDEDGACNTYEFEPEICETQWDFGNAICGSPSFSYQGNWQDSLRKRP